MVHPKLKAAGGGNVVAAYIVEALAREYSVSTLSWEPADIDTLNQLYGTSLNSSKLTVLATPLFLRFLDKFSPWLSPFRYAILLRICKKVKDKYDVIVSVNNEADFGCRGIQYIHDLPYAVHGRPQLGIKMLFPFHLWVLFKGKYRPWMVVAGFSYHRMKNNLTLVNSEWTGCKISEVYGFKCITVHPPAPGFYPFSPWEERENGFVCVGRISPFKRLERLVEIVGAVRSQVHDVHLHIIGTSDDPKYHQQLLSIVRECSWVSLHENVSREELTKLIVAHRYGIHGMEKEPFGIAVAEMVRGGCIVFVPRGSGPAEIVGGCEQLLYDNVEEAVVKILRVIGNNEEQMFLREYLDTRKVLFSTKKFVSSIQRVVRQFLSNNL